MLVISVHMDVVPITEMACPTTGKELDTTEPNVATTDAVSISAYAGLPVAMVATLDPIGALI